jgi:hypothetical protein
MIERSVTLYNGASLANRIRARITDPNGPVLSISYRGLSPADPISLTFPVPSQTRSTVFYSKKEIILTRQITDNPDGVDGDIDLPSSTGGTDTHMELLVGIQLWPIYVPAGSKILSAFLQFTSESETDGARPTGVCLCVSVYLFVSVSVSVFLCLSVCLSVYLLLC